MKLLSLTQSKRWPNGVIQKRGLFECRCGAQVERPFYAGLKNKTCGCGKNPPGVENPNFRHGQSHSALYQVWGAMVNRCRNKTDKDFRNYGGRGIAVCRQWMKASNFIQWAQSNGWKQGLVMDRIDNNKGYSPDNCRFVTPKESARNRRDSVLNVRLAKLIRDAIQTGMTQKEASEFFHIPYGSIKALAQGRTWKE